MTAKEKAENLYNKFQQYTWDDLYGYMPDDLETKKVAGKVIDELQDLLVNWGYHGEDLAFYVECKSFLNAL